MPRIPGALTLRIAVVLFVLLGVNTLMFLRLYVDHLRSTTAPTMAQAIYGEINSIRDDVRLLPVDRYRQWLDGFNSTGTLKLVELAAGTPTDALTPRYPYQQILQTELQRRAGADLHLEIVGASGDRRLSIDFNAGPHRYRLELPSAAIEVESVWPFAWLVASNLAIIVFGVAFAAWQINRPLQRSAAALAASSDQLAEIEMPDSAPKEFRVFADRFNRLARHLRAQDRERALLLASVSHDLRAPLTRIRLHAEMLDDEGQSSGERILIDTESMRHIIDQFLDYQRASDPALVALLDLSLVVADVVDRYERVGSDVRSISAGPAMILADPTVIERILGNLIDNALAYGAGPVEVGVSSEGEKVLLSVRDHGKGIDESQISRLLLPFERQDAARSDLGHCGLGLSICDRLVRELKGSMSLGNARDGGLLIQIRIPSRPAVPAEA